MMVHPYHYQLMRCLIRQKVKGDHRIPLTCADRQELVDKWHLRISKNHILKVLSEGDRACCQLSQFVLNELMRCVDYEDWNDFLRQNPVPEGQFDELQRVRAKKKVQQAVELRMAELRSVPQDVGQGVA